MQRSVQIVPVYSSSSTLPLSAPCHGDSARLLRPLDGLHDVHARSSRSAFSTACLAAAAPCAAAYLSSRSRRQKCGGSTARRCRVVEPGKRTSEAADAAAKEADEADDSDIATGGGRDGMEELWPKMYEWMKDDGMDMSDIAIEVAPVDVGQSGELGLVAKTRLLPGDILAWAPTRLLFTKAKAVDHWGDEIEELPDRVAIVLLLIHERFVKGASSKWRIYWEACPNFETDCCGPSFLWTEEEQAWLDGSDAMEASRQMQVHLEDEFADLQASLFASRPDDFPESSFNKKNYFWASAVVASRAYGDDGEGNNLAIAPLVDFINHQPGALQLTRFSNGIVAYASRGYEPGEQVWVNYGGKSNAELLTQYGFVDDNNKYDAVYIRMGEHLEVPDEAEEGKRRLLEEVLDGADPDCGIFKVSCNPREWQPRLLPAVRALVLDESKDDLPDTVNDLIAPQEPRIEVMAWGLLEKAFTARLEEYPASMAEDKAKVANDDLPERVRLALRLRVAEQELLEYALVHVSEQLQRAKAEVEALPA